MAMLKSCICYSRPGRTIWVREQGGIFELRTRRRRSRIQKHARKLGPEVSGLGALMLLFVRLDFSRAPGLPA